MSDFPSIDEVHDMLDKIAEELPMGFFNELNEGIVVLPQIKIHPESTKDNDLYIMGQYSRSITGRNIKIFYGSFKRVYKDIPREYLYEKLKDTLLHEFTHHLESLAGERGLEIKDAKDMEKFRRMK